MEAIFRDFRDQDYKRCQALVSEAWGFDQIFKPQKLAELAKLIYTKGALLGSSYQQVVEVDGDVVGFIFGFNETSGKSQHNFWFGISLLWKLLFIKTRPRWEKRSFIEAFKVHELNRLNVVAGGRSEIMLFVVAKPHQGKGFGKQLWSGFLSHCQQSGVKSVVVETNTDGASGFYERLGFNHIGDFESPVHAYATKEGQACMYEYVVPDAVE